MEYSNPKRENDPYALPDVEIFTESDYPPEDGTEMEPGFYYWYCFPGCLPDSDPIGPFPTYEDALSDARDGGFEEEED